MKKYKVTFTRIETYEYVREVEAEDEVSAVWQVACDTSWSYPDEPVYCESESTAAEIVP